MFGNVAQVAKGLFRYISYLIFMRTCIWKISFFSLFEIKWLYIFKFGNECYSMLTNLQADLKPNFGIIEYNYTVF